MLFDDMFSSVEGLLLHTVYYFCHLVLVYLFQKVIIFQSMFNQLFCSEIERGLLKNIAEKNLFGCANKILDEKQSKF